MIYHVVLYVFRTYCINESCVPNLKLIGLAIVEISSIVWMMHYSVKTFFCQSMSRNPLHLSAQLTMAHAFTLKSIFGHDIISTKNYEHVVLGITHEKSSQIWVKIIPLKSVLSVMSWFFLQFKQQSHCLTLVNFLITPKDNITMIGDSSINLSLKKILIIMLTKCPLCNPILLTELDTLVWCRNVFKMTPINTCEGYINI